jgi:nicotinate-nucleotide adenylyltransferase
VSAIDSGEGTAVGILGGTFNPPHLGHLALASNALSQLHLSRVVLMPAALAPHKADGGGGLDPGHEHRLAMCRLAIKETPRLSVCTLELHRGGPSYTVDTLRDIQAKHPDVPLTFIMGADMARSLPSWREPEALLELAELAVAERDGAERQRLSETLGLRYPRARVHFLDMAPVDLSSSMVREHVAIGEQVDRFVEPSVAFYISRHALYLNPVSE